MKTPFATLLRPAEFKGMPWKNGQGQTAEIALMPSGTSLESGDFLWRLSAARIQESGDFSPFPGFDRFLTLTEGTGLVLHASGSTMHIRPGDVHHFSGDEVVRAELPAGPVGDLGLLYRRGKVQAEMQVLEFNRARSFRMDAPENFFFVISGTFSASCYPGETRLELEAGTALRVSAPRGEAERVVLLEPTSAKGRIAAIEII